MHRMVIALFSILLFSAPLMADSWRCGRKVVRTGDSAGDLLRLCGEPLHKDRGVARLRQGGVSGEQRVERWHYRKSRRSIERIVLLRNGKIVGIEIGSR